MSIEEMQTELARSDITFIVTEGLLYINGNCWLQLILMSDIANYIWVTITYIAYPTAINKGSHKWPFIYHYILIFINYVVH